MANQQNQVVNFRNSEILTTAIEHYDLDAKDLTDDNGQRVDKLSPFRNGTIYNDGNTKLKVFVNQRKGYDIIPPNTVYQIKDDRIIFLKLENIGAVSGSYFITLDSQESELSILKGLLAKALK